MKKDIQRERFLESVDCDSFRDKIDHAITKAQIIYKALALDYDLPWLKETGSVERMVEDLVMSTLDSIKRGENQAMHSTGMISVEFRLSKEDDQHALDLEIYFNLV